MARKRPPLHLLQLFEAAGRHLSFKKAAEELFLSPSAISHQIKSLEEHLDMALFTRQARGVKLTSAGTNYLVVVQDMFNRLDEGTAKVKQQFARQSLRIATFSTLASNVIIPRLAEFKQTFPDIELLIETNTEFVDLRYDEFDIALRLGDGSWPDVIAEKIFDLQVSPMCSSAFAQTYRLKNVEQLLNAPLIKLSSMPEAWPTWLQSVGIDEPELNYSLSLGTYDAVIQAAQQGIGLALGAVPLENAALRSGALVKPFNEQIQFKQSCYAVYRTQDAQRNDLTTFLTWFKQQL